MTINTFCFPTLIHHGPGVRHKIPGFLKERVKRPLLVTDRGIAQLAMLGELRDDLTRVGLAVAVFSGVSGNPVKSQVEAGVAAYRDHGADSIVGLGGGAALDVAKAIALLAHHAGDLFEYEDGLSGARLVDKEIPLWVGVPTTAGTGSEVGRSTVISDDETHVKKIIFSPRLMAPAVFADPELTLGLPAKITAATGMDALAHCVEAYLARNYHPICDGVALEGLRLAGRNLPRCIQTPTDIEGRSQMLMASMMGAIAFQKGLGVTHSCAHALSTVADLHHGLAIALMIDHALKRNIAAVPLRFEILAQTVGLPDPSGISFIHWLEKLKKQIGIPGSLRAAGVNPETISQLSRLAFADSCHQNNPRPCTEEDFQQIFSEAFQ
jgi:alcohol dehydrogenase class IV